MRNAGWWGMGLVGLAAAFAGCTEPPLAGGSTSGTAAAASAPMNRMCPMKGDAVTEAGGTAEFKGQVIGFCCTDCLAAWNALPEGDKEIKALALRPR